MSTPYIPSELQLLQADIGRKLQSEAYFSDIPVFVVREQTIEEAVAKAVMGNTYQQGHTGLAVKVEMPSASCNAESDKLPGPFLTVSYLVSVHELPMVNFGARGTKKSAEEVALNVMNMLHLFDFGRTIASFRASPNALVPNLSQLPKVIFEVEFWAAYELPDADSQFRLAKPTASIDDSFLLTLSHSDGDAVLYWTDQTDAYPSASGGGTLYSAPFTTAAGKVVRVCAYKPGYQSSLVLPITITA